MSMMTNLIHHILELVDRGKAYQRSGNGEGEKLHTVTFRGLQRRIFTGGTAQWIRRCGLNESVSGYPTTDQLG